MTINGKTFNIEEMPEKEFQNLISEMNSIMERIKKENKENRALNDLIPRLIEDIKNEQANSELEQENEQVDKRPKQALSAIQTK